ncbi:peptidoglycan recognition protein family protein [Jiangella endophytica]|uniref:peptidoglycan recognition protein family protein n=1 Tax=Jiangella endophytica TaxID=1623398 RepID=UPI001300A691|nr:peptidoglycan recognition family protein [Jiangella endophytica]
MTTYLPRSAWTSTARGGAQLTGNQLVGLACHWPGSTTDAYGVETADRVAGRLRGWRAYHVEDRGWSDIGYNFAIDQAGRVWDLRGSARVGAHSASPSNPDANHEFVGVLCIVGDRERPTSAMSAAFWDFRRDVFLRRWPGRTDVRGHREVSGAQTACPGDPVIELTNTPEETDMTPEQAAMLNQVARDTAYIREQNISIARAVVKLATGSDDITASELKAVQDAAAGKDR